MSEDFIFKAKHVSYYRDERAAQNKGRICVPGMQYLVHLLRGGYLGEDLKNGRNRKLLDVGCGSGFNAVTMSMLGWDVTGCEINEDIVAHAKETCRSYGYEIPVDVGENEHLPYADATFDFLLSMNVIHYAESRQGMERSIREYARILKPGGRILLFTIAKNSWLLKNAERVSTNIMRVHRSDDYRNGEQLYVFQSQKELRDAFRPVLANMRIAVNRTDFFTRVLHHMILTGVRI